MMRIPFNGTFELTARCNLRCKMCLIRIDHKRMRELGGKERNEKEWISMAQEVKEAGTIGLLLTGGEPLLHPDFKEIYREIAQMGFVLTLYTNATLITPEIYQILERYPPHRIGITVYGASPETYERVTGSAEAYERMLAGVHQLRALPSILSVRTTIIKDNRKDLSEITGWARSLGKDVEFSLSRIVTKPVRGGISDAESCRLTPEENAALLKKRNIELLVTPFRKFIQEHIPCELPDIGEQYTGSGNRPFHTSAGGQTLYGCDAGMNSYAITWDGRLIGCQLLEDCWSYPFINGFLHAWEAFPLQVKHSPLPDKCIGCGTNCCVCPATRFAETGSLSGWPEYLCREGKLANKMEMEVVSELEKIMEEELKRCMPMSHPN